jgi:hypothetical protein
MQNLHIYRTDRLIKEEAQAMKTRVLSVWLLLGAQVLLGLLLLWAVAGPRAPALAAAPSLVAAPPHEPAGTFVGGVLNAPTIWSLGGSPYTLLDDVVVTRGVTLTLQPGVVVKGQSGTQLRVLGHLEALGAQPITFTSSLDTGPGQWQGLLFDGGSGHLRAAVVRYGGQHDGYTYSNITARNVLSGELRIEDSLIVSTAHAAYTDYGLYITNSRVAIHNTIFADNGNSTSDLPLRLEAADLSRVELLGNVFRGNGRDRVLIAGGALAGPVTLPDQAGLEGYQLAGELLVPAGLALTIAPGVTIMGQASAQLRVAGHLEALGAPPITFTSATNSGPGQWQGLLFDGGSGHLRAAVVRYGGQYDGYTYSNITARNVVAGEVRIEDSLIVEGADVAYADYGLYAANSRVTIQNTTFAHNGNSSGDYALYATGASTVDVAYSQFRQNPGCGLGINASNLSLLCTAVTANAKDGLRFSGAGSVLAVQDSSIYNNAGLGINNISGVAVDARGTWWGSTAGPYHAVSNPTGTGNAVSNDVLFSPWLADLPACLANYIYLPLLLR